MALELTPATAVSVLRSSGLARGGFLAVAIDIEVGAGFTFEGQRYFAVVTGSSLRDLIGKVESECKPRWVWWDHSTAAVFAKDLVPIERCWDVLTVDRLLNGGWQTAISTVWSAIQGLDPATVPRLGQLDLLDGMIDEGLDMEDPVRPDRHLRPEWVADGWRRSPIRMAAWSALAASAADWQQPQLEARQFPAKALSTAKSESAADLLCAEMEIGGLPIDDTEVRRIISDAAGPRPRSYAEEDAARDVRDAVVLSHLPGSRRFNLRNPDDVKSMLRRVEVDLPDTRAWRLEQIREKHPLIEALLQWRKAERIATTYGYRWLNDHVDGGRLRGDWTACDGAAGRMTASAGLHNLPSEMRSAVQAEPGYVFVRADLGQIEPRVLAAVSGDEALIAATQDDDLYLPVAQQLNVGRDVAKVAVLGAMYGSTTGESAHALRQLAAEYPTAMGHLDAAARKGQAGEDVFTVGGRRVRMWSDKSVAGDIDRARQVAAARGRFARNAIIQGAAAEFFKVWAVIVRSKMRNLGGEIVLCLHDEILVHVPLDQAEPAAALVEESVSHAAFYWSPSKQVRFLADVSVISNWSLAKG